MMISAEFIDSNLEGWNDRERILLGNKGSFNVPSAYVGVTIDGVQFQLIDLYAYDEYACFKSIKISGSVLVIGFGESVHFINMDTRNSKSVKLDGYFGELYMPEDFDLNNNEFNILVTSCEYLHHFGFSGEEFWKSELLGIDGVIVQDIKPPLIWVDGEWDPPGGWEQVTLNLSNGKNVI